MLGGVPVVASTPYVESVAAKPSFFVLDPGLSRFALVLLWYVIGLAALATLTPFNFVGHVHGYTWATTRSDIALNLAFLFPVGFLLRLARAERAWPLALDALGLGILVSCALELSQLFLPTRVTSPTDVLTNGLGAWAGGLAHARVGSYLDRRLQRQLSLHLPLANLLYLVVPLISLDAMATRSWHGCLPELPLTLFIAEIAAGLYKHRLEGEWKPFPNAFSATIGLVFGIGYMPIAVSAPLLWWVSMPAVALLTRFVIAFGTRLPATERRFVPITVARAAPFFFWYVLLLGAHDWLGGLWHPEAKRVDVSMSGVQVLALALLRDVTAFTLVGYLGSELQARSPESIRRIFARILLFAVPASLYVGGLRFDAVSLATFGHVSLLVAGTVAGGLIHRAQLRLVRSWSRNSMRPARPSFLSASGQP
jgi:glycopeptide antibiotics resistance protein